MQQAYNFGSKPSFELRCVFRSMGLAMEGASAHSQAGDAPPSSVGACLGIPAMTARHAVPCDGPVRERTPLIAGGAGSVGNCAIPIAKRESARIVSTVSSEATRAIALAASADFVVNYKDGRATEEIEAAIGKNAVDRIVEIDLAANLSLILPMLRYGGTVLVYGSTSNMTPQVAHRHAVEPIVILESMELR